MSWLQFIIGGLIIGFGVFYWTAWMLNREWGSVVASCKEANRQLRFENEKLLEDLESSITEAKYWRSMFQKEVSGVHEIDGSDYSTGTSSSGQQ